MKDFVITPILLDRIRYEYERTAITPQDLLDGAINPPDGLTPRRIENWLKGTLKKAHKRQFEFVLNEWESKPDYVPPPLKKAKPAHAPKHPLLKEKEGYLPIATEDRARLEGYRALNWLPSLVLENAQDIPPGLSSYMISRWLSGNDNTKPEYLEFVFERCEALTRLANSLRKWE